MLTSMGWKTAVNVNPKTSASSAEAGLVKYQPGNAALKSCNTFLMLVSSVEILETCLC